MEVQENKEKRKYRNEGLGYCPFCGETYKLDLRKSPFGGAYVICLRCKAQTGIFESTPGGKTGEQKARDVWNMRRKPRSVLRDCK